MLEMMQFLNFVNVMEYFLHEHFQWTHISGKLKWISSGRNVVVGVNSGDNIYYRTGMSAGAPTGSGWKHIGGKLMMIEIYENEVVGTNSGHAIYKCPVSGVSAPKQNHNVQVTAKWSSIPGRLTRISKGKAGVWGVNKSQNIYRLNSDGKYFLLESLLSYGIFIIINK